MIKLKRISFSKSSKSLVGRLILPSKWLDYLELTPEDNEVILELTDNKIIVKKLKGVVVVDER